MESLEDMIKGNQFRQYQSPNSLKVDGKALTLTQLKQYSEEFDHILLQIAEYNQVADNFGSAFNVEVREKNLMLTWKDSIRYIVLLKIEQVYITSSIYTPFIDWKNEEKRTSFQGQYRRLRQKTAEYSLLLQSLSAIVRNTINFLLNNS